MQAFEAPEIKMEDTLLYMNNRQKRKVRIIEREKQGFVFKMPLSILCFSLSVMSAEQR
jgi:hypothetical protein